MEISSYLQKESRNGRKAVKHIEFKGEPLDMASVYRRRAWAFDQRHSCQVHFLCILKLTMVVCIASRSSWGGCTPSKSDFSINHGSLTTDCQEENDENRVVPQGPAAARPQGEGGRGAWD
jgi:hypothetical protein